MPGIRDRVQCGDCMIVTPHVWMCLLCLDQAAYYGTQISCCQRRSLYCTLVLSDHVFLSGNYFYKNDSVSKSFPPNIKLMVYLPSTKGIANSTGQQCWIQMNASYHISRIITAFDPVACARMKKLSLKLGRSSSTLTCQWCEKWWICCRIRTAFNPWSTGLWKVSTGISGKLRQHRHMSWN